MLKPGDQIDLGDGDPWTVTRLELRGGLQLPGATEWQTWALLTRNGARRWLQVDAPGDGDERRVLDLVEQRLALGRRQYGPLQVDGDSRDWSTEALEELLDAVVYLACELLRQRRGA